MGPKALVDEQEPFKLLKRARYPTDLPVNLPCVAIQHGSSVAHGTVHANREVAQSVHCPCPHTAEGGSMGGGTVERRAWARRSLVRIQPSRLSLVL